MYRVFIVFVFFFLFLFSSEYRSTTLAPTSAGSLFHVSEVMRQSAVSGFKLAWDKHRYIIRQKEKKNLKKVKGNLPN